MGPVRNSQILKIYIMVMIVSNSWEFGLGRFHGSTFEERLEWKQCDIGPKSS